MGHDWSDNILITKLPAEPQTGDELNAIIAKLTFESPKSDLIVDLGAVDKPTCQTLRRLTTLCRVLSEHGYCCIFYNLNAATRRIFRIFHLYGFDRIFKIANASEIVLTPSAEQVDSGILEIRNLNNVKPLERRKYFRLKIPWWLQMNVLLWHGGRYDDYHKLLPGHFWHGSLVDISEGGIQVAIEAAEETMLGKGQLIGLEFRPNPAEQLLVFDAQIKEILPTADSRNVCLGLKFIELKANPEGRQALQKLYNPDGTYYEAKENITI
ncbi:MAG: PilZ domain-containing protein [Planctomycetota bacterium]|jgi:anti-anti-sigma regulatory factor